MNLLQLLHKKETPMLRFKQFLLENDLFKRYTSRYQSKNPIVRGLQTLALKGSVPVPSVNKPDLPAGLVKYGGKPEETTLHHSKLTPTQPFVYGPKVKSMKKSGDLKRVDVVKRKNGKHVIVDGHHTYTALRASGIKHIPVNVYEEK